MANIERLEVGVFLPAAQYEEEDKISKLRDLILSTGRVNYLEPGNVEDVKDLFIFFKKNEKEEKHPVSFQFKILLENGTWIAIRDQRRNIVSLAEKAFQEANGKFPDYQETMDLLLAKPARYEKFKNKENGFEFYVLGLFCERDEVILKQIAFEAKKEFAKPKLKAPPTKKVERKEVVFKKKATLNLSSALLSSVTEETKKQENEVFEENNSSSIEEILNGKKPPKTTKTA